MRFEAREIIIALGVNACCQRSPWSAFDSSSHLHSCLCSETLALRRSPLSSSRLSRSGHRHKGRRGRPAWRRRHVRGRNVVLAIHGSAKTQHTLNNLLGLSKFTGDSLCALPASCNPLGKFCQGLGVKAMSCFNRRAYCDDKSMAHLLVVFIKVNQRCKRIAIIDIMGCDLLHGRRFGSPLRMAGHCTATSSYRPSLERRRHQHFLPRLTRPSSWRLAGACPGEGGRPSHCPG